MTIHMTTYGSYLFLKHIRLLIYTEGINLRFSGNEDKNERHKVKYTMLMINKIYSLIFSFYIFMKI